MAPNRLRPPCRIGIVVVPGHEVDQRVEGRVRAMGGTRLYAETSGRPQYASTRAFYEHMGFALCELLEDFYAPGDARATYVKPIAPS